MNLSKKKSLAAKTLRVGKGRLQFKQENLNEIKEAITRQDIKQLNQEGIITIKPIKGRKKNVTRKHRRGPGKIKMKVNKRKQEYVKITRKLRAYAMSLRDRGVLERELYKKIRNKIRMREFRSKAGMKDFLNKHEDVDFDFVSKDKKVETKKIKKIIAKKIIVKAKKETKGKAVVKKDIKDTKTKKTKETKK
jgi:large subunit ribosomal protein L19e